MRPFVYDHAAQRVIFGIGSIDRLADEVRRLGAHRVLILSTPAERGLADDAARRLGPLSAGIFAEAVMHVPIESARAARQRATELGADCCVSIGGGSTTGLGKAIALESSLPIVAVPTTYAGSEMTSIYGLTESGIKKTGRDRRVLPVTVLYDPQLTLTLPPQISGPSGMNAIAHCVEGLYAEDANPHRQPDGRGRNSGAGSIAPDRDTATERSRRTLRRALRGLVGGYGARSRRHGHPPQALPRLGGSFNLPHAEVHTVILPHATAFNREAAPEAMRADR